MAGSMDEAPPIPPRSLAAELAIVFAVQVGLVAGLVRLGDVLPLGGSVHALVALVFVFLPVLVLDRRGRPYARYGIAARRPVRDLSFAVGLMVVLFTPIAFAAGPFWTFAFGLDLTPWSFAWPEHYPEAALSHLLIVALPEEVFYRGYALGRLDDIFRGRVRLLGVPVGWGLLIQAVLFALGHYLIDLEPQRLAVFFPALAFGWLRLRTGSIAAPVALHAGANIFMEVLRAGYGLSA
jgi:membrane protease YdiL (CAAX protease family)